MSVMFSYIDNIEKQNYFVQYYVGYLWIRKTSFDKKAQVAFSVIIKANRLDWDNRGHFISQNAINYIDKVFNLKVFL